MRVALDCGPLLDPPTGVGRYTRHLATALETVGVEVSRYAIAFGGRADEPVRRLRVSARLAQSAWRRLGRPTMDRFVGPADVVHATNFVLPALARTPGVVTVHDLSFERDDTWPGGERLRKLVPWSLERAAAAVVPSETVAEELRRRYGLADSRVHVTHEGVAPEFFGATRLSAAALGRMGIPGRFVLAVGTIEPRKNLRRLLDAWALVGGDLDGWTLVIAGPKGWGGNLPPVDGVVLLGWVADETLPGLLAAADVFCYPSLYEGFGLPPLEAMAAGTPALAGRYSAAPEVLGDAALLVDPTDVEELAEGLRRLGGDDNLRRQLAMTGRARAASFTWETTALQTKKVYESVAGS